MDNKQFGELQNSFFEELTKNCVDYEKMKDDIVSWIKEWVNSNGNEKTSVIIGMSGGKDSTVTAKLLSEALGPDRVFGLIMPNGDMPDIEDAYRACEFAGIRHKVINIRDIYKTFLTDMFGMYDNNNDRIKTNLPSRIRMSVLYSFASQFNDGNCFVVNTSNFSERLIGYETLWGDSVGDFSPLGFLFVNDVVSIGYILDVPHDLLIKSPADGMSGKTDEEVLGFTYDNLEGYYKGKNNLWNIRKRLAGKAWKKSLMNIPTYGRNHL